MNFKFSILVFIVFISFSLSTTSCTSKVAGPCDDLEYKEGTVIFNGEELQLLETSELSISSDDAYIFIIGMGDNDCLGGYTLLLNFDGKPEGQNYDIEDSTETPGKYRVIRSLKANNEPISEILISGTISMEETEEDIWKIEIDATTDTMNADLDFSGEVDFN